MIKNSPILLAIETSSEQASAALIVDQKITQQVTEGVVNHSQSILPMVQSLLAEAGLVLSDCQAIAFGSGPGSFTGVRTACGVVQGLAFGANLPVIPVVTLLALAEQCRMRTGATNVVTALDARMGEVYWAHYHFDVSLQTWSTVVEPTLSAPELVLPEITQGVQCCGNCFSVYQDRFGLPVSLLTLALFAVPEAQAVMRLALNEWVQGRVISAEQAQPLYLRNKVALTIAERQAVLTSKVG